MHTFSRFFYICLSVVFLEIMLLGPLPVRAQGSANPPTGGSAQSLLYLPLAKGEGQDEPLQANPLSVAVTVDSGQTITETIPVEGGTISVTASNGTRYTLTIPADALLSDQEIVMSPLVAASGIPLHAGLMAGIQLAPDGLRLLQGATLTIEGAPEFDAGLELVGFGYQEDGKEFHLRPVTESNGQYSLTLDHFSGYGVSAGTAQEIQAQVDEHAPTAPDDFAAQHMAMLGEMSDAMVLERWYDKTLVKDLLEGRDGDYTALERGIWYFPVWLREVKESGLEAEFADRIEEGWKHLLIGLGNAIEKSWMECKAGDATRVIRILRLSRIVTMLPVEERRVWIGDGYVNGVMVKMATDCATFELDFDSTVVQDVPNVPHVGQAHDSHLRAENIRIQFGLNTRLVEPSQGALVYQSFNLAGSTPCSSSITTTDSTLTVTDARMNLNFGWGETPKFSFQISPGKPTETIVHSCPNVPPLIIEPNFWHIGFWRMNWDDAKVNELSLQFNQWRYVGKSLYAEMIKDHPMLAENNYYHGTTWMVLAHAPIQ